MSRHINENTATEPALEVKSTVKPPHLQYVHYLRGLAILFIVGFHCRTSFEWSNVYVMRSWFSVLTLGTVIFVFIGGLLFQHINQHRFDYRKYLGKKVKFVILPYLIMSIPAILNQLYLETSYPWMPEWLADKSKAWWVVYMVFTGKHFGPFWFIPMITLFYLTAPLLLWLDRQQWFYSYLFPVIFVAGLFLHEFGFSANTLESFAFYLPIYFFGMFINHHRTKLVAMKWKLIWPLLILYLAVVLLEVSGTIAIGKPYGFNTAPAENATLFNFGKFKVCLLCLILLNLFYIFRDVKISLLDFMANYSFGVYFIHLYIIRLTEKTLGYFSINVYFDTLTFPLWMALITALCVAFIRGIKLLTGPYSRYVAGS